MWRSTYAILHPLVGSMLAYGNIPLRYSPIQIHETVLVVARSSLALFDSTSAGADRLGRPDARLSYSLGRLGKVTESEAEARRGTTLDPPPSNEILAVLYANLCKSQP